jgi:hypothetical protein
VITSLDTSQNRQKKKKKTLSSSDHLLAWQNKATICLLDDIKSHLKSMNAWGFSQWLPIELGESDQITLLLNCPPLAFFNFQTWD